MKFLTSQDFLDRIQSPAFIAGFVGVLKYGAQVIGIEIPDQTLNAFVNGVAALAMIIGIWSKHPSKTQSAVTPISAQSISDLPHFDKQPIPPTASMPEKSNDIPVPTQP